MNERTTAYLWGLLIMVPATLIIVKFIPKALHASHPSSAPLAALNYAVNGGAGE